MTEDETTGDGPSLGVPPVADASRVLQLTATIMTEIVNKKATCPFLGTAVATDNLPVRNEATNPLASIEDVRRLGNTGGG